MAQSRKPGEHWNFDTQSWEPDPNVSQDSNERISRHEMLMDIALTLSRRGTCLRSSVGAVLARDGRIVSSGYVGAPSGEDHCTSDICNPEQPCTRTVHAEANAIAFAARHGVATEGTTLYCTLSPCMDCTKLLINAGIETVIYLKPYRDLTPMNLLSNLDIAVMSYDALIKSQV